MKINNKADIIYTLAGCGVISAIGSIVYDALREKNVPEKKSYFSQFKSKNMPLMSQLDCLIDDQVKCENLVSKNARGIPSRQLDLGDLENAKEKVISKFSETSERFRKYMSAGDDIAIDEIPEYAQSLQELAKYVERSLSEKREATIGKI